MKKYIIIVAVTAACLALCAAVWPQTETFEEIQISAVGDPVPAVEDTGSEAEIPKMSEEETIELSQTEPFYEATPAPWPVTEEVTATPEVQSTAEPKSEQEQESAPAPIPSPASPQAVADPQPGDMVYVPGFGWLERQGPGEVIYDENMYENGNKIGVMG